MDKLEKAITIQLMTDSSEIHDGLAEAPGRTGDDLPISGRLVINGKAQQVIRADTLADIIRTVSDYLGGKEGTQTGTGKNGGQPEGLMITEQTNVQKTFQGHSADLLPGITGDLIASFLKHDENHPRQFVIVPAGTFAPVVSGTVTTTGKDAHAESNDINNGVNEWSGQGRENDVVVSIKTTGRPFIAFNIRFGRYTEHYLPRSMEYQTMLDNDDSFQFIFDIDRSNDRQAGREEIRGLLNIIHQISDAIHPGGKNVCTFRAGCDWVVLQTAQEITSPDDNSTIQGQGGIIEDNGEFVEKIVRFAAHMNEVFLLINEKKSLMSYGLNLARGKGRDGLLIPNQAGISQKAVFDAMPPDFRELARQTGIHLKADGTIGVNEMTLEQFMSTGGDDRASAVKSVINALYERFQALFSASLLPLSITCDQGHRCVRTGTSQAEDMLEEKRYGLEKKMNILQMLIDSSMALQGQFEKRSLVSADVQR